ASLKLENGRQEINTKLQELKTFIDNLVSSGFVTEKASVKFAETYADFTNSATKTIESLNGLSQFLKTATQEMQATDSSLANQIFLS
ncbi:MAG: WXG100 family type VII secretion target, partial [Propionibacteriaceae bacterium]|nr:WXG100 family type VII secretion target [Propionibacteriaceae bacterium]